jgi:hypothetical protein
MPCSSKEEITLNIKEKSIKENWLSEFVSHVIETNLTQSISHTMDLWDQFSHKCFIIFLLANIWIN